MHYSALISASPLWYLLFGTPTVVHCIGPSFSPTKIHPSELAEALSARVAVADTTGDCTAVSTSAERQFFIYFFQPLTSSTPSP